MTIILCRGRAAICAPMKGIPVQAQTSRVWFSFVRRGDLTGEQSIDWEHNFAADHRQRHLHILDAHRRDREDVVAEHDEISQHPAR